MQRSSLSIADIIARELKVKVDQVEATINLLDDGATVPFIARYRKEATQGLDDTQLRQLNERLYYLRELEARRQTILQSIESQGQLTPELQQRIEVADSKARLEDLYLPFRPKRRTKAHIAREAGLGPLAEALLANPTLDPLLEAESYVDGEKGVADVAAALEGVQQIWIEQFAEEPELIQHLREYVWEQGILQSNMAPSANEGNKKNTAQKFTDYFTYSEAIKKIPSHRALALLRGRRENVLQLSFMLPDVSYGEKKIASYFHVENLQRVGDARIFQAIATAWKTKLLTKLELEALSRLRELADEEAIKVFARNVRDLLLAAPAGPQVTMGLDPGIRTGVKVVVVDETGKVLDYMTVYPLAPNNEWHGSIADLAKLIVKHDVRLISIGNGTASRETERLVAELMQQYPDLSLTKVIVSEAGASVYSASELAANEFPDLDVSIRGAVSIARRLQDPLAELVKIDPKAIGVGQYQHDVNQTRLARSLEAVVEDCVNAVGVDVNRASVALLMRVSGFNETLAKNLVQHRETHGAFSSREILRSVPRMGDKAFQQAAGFLRIIGGENPLDQSAVHPEAYPLVERVLSEKQWTLPMVLGDVDKIRSLEPQHFVDTHYGLSTVKDVLTELEKPGRDPRPVFRTACFQEGIKEITDLKVGMLLEGVVSNVTNFGIFVDVGVHQDGLVHISEMAERFVKDPHAVAKAGEVVQVKVMEVNLERRRIGLSMRLQERAPVVSAPRGPKEKSTVAPSRDKPVKTSAFKKKPAEPVAKKPQLFNTMMADALSRCLKDA